MSTFLIVISLILHVISFFCIILFYIRMEKMRDIEQKQASIMKDMEEILSSYVLEIKEENEKFLLEVRQTESKSKKTTKKGGAVKPKETDQQIQPSKISSIDTIEEQLTEDDILNLLPTFETEEKAGVRKEKTTSGKINKKPQLKEKQKEDGEVIETELKEEPPLFDSLPLGTQVKILAEEGLSTTEIAKRLHKGKTEIELFLKFNS